LDNHILPGGALLVSWPRRESVSHGVDVRCGRVVAEGCPVFTCMARLR
jgi:hypothetical protein